MSSERTTSAGEVRLHRVYAWFDPESAAVVTILLGLFQLVLSVPLVQSFETLPKLFVLPVLLGILIVTGGSFIVAHERNPSRQLLQGCVYANTLGLLGTVLAFCLYCYSLSSITSENLCSSGLEDEERRYFGCPADALAGFTWCITLLLLLYNTGAVILHGVLSVSALKTLKAH